jgi:hypothetical protein
MYAKRTYALSLGSIPDVDGTQRRLQNILFQKHPHENDDFHKRIGPDIGGAPLTQNTPKTRLSEPGGASSSASAEGGHARTPGSGSATTAAASRAATCAGAGEQAELRLATLTPFEIERERQAFINSICSDSTRLDVRDWMVRIFNLTVKRAVETHTQAQMKERRRRRARSSGGSDSGTSAATLQAAGDSVVSAGDDPPPRAPSLISQESLVVHDGEGICLLSGQDRLRAYLANEIPELKAHVDACVEARAEEVRKRVDGELRNSYLRRTTKHAVFSNEANYLRWTNYRTGWIQRRLEDEMPKWIWEAIQSWDQVRAFKERDDVVVSESDLIFDYLTKRAAHIDSGSLPTGIPIFKPLKSSYSMPKMWRDKYI